MTTLIDQTTLKRCNHCKTDKPLSLMVYDKNSVGLHRPLCRECKAKQQLAAKKKAAAKAKAALVVKPSRFGASTQLNPTQRRSLGLGGYAGARVREKNEALPPQINKMAGKYVSPTWNMRSGATDHLKHKSVGM
jgi:hypothetical protein